MGIRCSFSDALWRFQQLLQLLPTDKPYQLVLFDSIFCGICLLATSLRDNVSMVNIGQFYCRSISSSALTVT